LIRRGLVALLTVVALAACGGTREAPAAGAEGNCLDTAASASATQPGNRTVPALALACLSGDGTGSLNRLSKPAVVNLWASWCEPCRTELPAMESFAQRSGGEVLVVGVATGDTREAARSVVQDLRLTFPQLYDRDKSLLLAVDKVSLPVTLFLDARGTVVYVYNSTALDAGAVARLVEQHLGVAVGR
jgi:cytochrome c biogenesis protein CcmG, thiol:disulfide interchange protein DsbE